MKRGPYQRAVPKNETFICGECQQSFEYGWRTRRPRYCSSECRTVVIKRNMKVADIKHRQKNYHPPGVRSCVMCDIPYTPKGTRADSRFCSPKCCLRGNQIERTYKLQLVDYHRMYVSQNASCGACLLPFNNAVPFIDHDHTTGKVRGLVHGNCNTVLGFVKDNPTTLENLAKYLRRES